MIGYPFVRYVHDRMAKEITDPYYAALAHAAGQAFGVILFPRNATVFPIYELTAIVLASEEANAKDNIIERIMNIRRYGRGGESRIRAHGRGAVPSLS